MAEKNKRKHNSRLFFVIISIILLLIIIFFFLFYFKPLETRVIEVKFSVADHPAFDLDSSKLVFGKVLPGSNAIRNIVLENKYDFPIEVKVLASKNIVQFLQADSSFVIEAFNTSKFPVNLRIPNNAVFGDYSGKILFEIRKKHS